MSLKVAADCPGFDLCIALSVLPHHSHQVLQLCTGVARQLGEHCLSQAPRIVHLQPLLATLRPGDRLRVSVAAAAWPQVSVNPGSGLHGPGASSMDHQVITLHTVLECSALTMQPMAPPPWAEQQGIGA